MLSVFVFKNRYNFFTYFVHRKERCITRPKEKYNRKRLWNKKKREYGKDVWAKYRQNIKINLIINFKKLK